MDPTYKISDLLRKKRPVPRKFNTNKEFDATLFKGITGHSNITPNINAYINKLSFSRTPERSRPGVTLNYAHIPEIKPLNKEIRSSSVSKKEERTLSVKRSVKDRDPNISLVNERSFANDGHEHEHNKKPETLDKMQIYLGPEEVRNGHKRNLSSKRSISVTKNTRRLNSSCADSRQKIQLQEKRGSHAHKNSSVLNNSMMFDEPGNISRDQSYLNEFLEEDASRISDNNTKGAYNISNSPTRRDESHNDLSSGSRIKVGRSQQYENEESHKHKDSDKPAPLLEKVIIY